VLDAGGPDRHDRQQPTRLVQRDHREKRPATWTRRAGAIGEKGAREQQLDARVVGESGAGRCVA
jgi:hypothetical protein